ncbi:hypothetical protein TELCIR_03282 [Teladorsagia circumcincta]|uniref:Amiloride-sensitive sodium channel n=1 Tax=Teladorsagia circumcincta TaxID=45464 RepID=A0A2G9UWR8_TELCI|nr:hypothetical protein TELCIR_03282 [Teladorsagia circumcincta]
MSLIFTVLGSSPTRKLLGTDVDENTETESLGPFPFRRAHSETPTESPVSFEGPVHAAVTEPLDPCYHDTANSHSNASPLPLITDGNSDPERRYSFKSCRKDFQDNPKGFRRAAKFSGCHSTELKHTMIDFGETTTAHGIPMILNTSRLSLRIFWIVFSTVSLICFVFQSLLVVEKYQKKEKIVNVELEFESAPFPAITICNMNPFKNHLARSVPEISETLDAFHQAVTYSNNANNEEIKRRKRDSKYGKTFKKYTFLLLYDCDGN